VKATADSAALLDGRRSEVLPHKIIQARQAPMEAVDAPGPQLPPSVTINDAGAGTGAGPQKSSPPLAHRTRKTGHGGFLRCVGGWHEQPPPPHRALLLGSLPLFTITQQVALPQANPWYLTGQNRVGWPATPFSSGST
jgi:hypothetical protein